jgi:hypothetical protein
MSTSNSRGAWNLTEDEQILHHHAATLKNDLETYRAYSRSTQDWKDLFKDHLVRFILIIRFHEPFSDSSQRKSMNFYAEANTRSPGIVMRIHPLLLSLSKTIEASEIDPDISAISENDERALSSDRYTLPSALPPLSIHLNGSNSLSLLSYQNAKLMRR